MLDNIDKVSTEFDSVKKRYHPPTKPGTLKPGKAKKKSGAEVELSEFSKYLRSINWILKDLSYPSSDKVQLRFFFSIFEFRTEIEFSRFFDESRQLYTVIGETRRGTDRIRSLVQLSMKKSIVDMHKKYFPPKLDSMTTLFENIVSLGIFSEVKGANSVMLRELSRENIDEELVIDMRKITLAVFRLIEKMGKLNFSRFYFPPDDDSPLLIEKAGSVKLG